MVQKIVKESVQAVQMPTNHIVIVDCSGSMYYTLPNLREDLKNKLTSMIGADDRLSLIYFSGRNQSDFIFKNYEVKNAVELSNVKSSIDRWLQPIGVTAFQKPLEIALTAIDKNFFNSIVFMTDGYNNDCSTADVFKALEAIKPHIDATYFVEYGYYVDSKLIGQMAENVGGVVVNADSFQDLVVKIEQSLKGITAPKIKMDAPATYSFGLTTDNDVIVYKADDNNVIYVDGETKGLFWGTTGGTLLGEEFALEVADNNSIALTDQYTEQLVLAYGNFVLGRFNEAEQLLFEIGDIALIEQYSKAFGKQKINDFKTQLLSIIKNETPLFESGREQNYSVNPDAYTVLELLNDLTNDEGALVYTSHPNFNYKRVSAKRLVNNKPDMKQLLNEAASIEEIEEALNAEGTKFEYDDPNEGSPFAALSFHSSRVNVNFTTSRKGKVKNLPANKWNLTEYPSRQTKSYNIIKDGILNLSSLPVTISNELRAKLITSGVSIISQVDINGNAVYLIDFSNLPVVNKRMVSEMNSQEFANTVFKLEEQKAAQKVFRYYDKQVNEKVLVEDEELNEFLKGIGITYNGYNPSSTKAPSTDCYFAPVLELKIKGLSSLPSIDAVKKKIAENKALNFSDSLIKKYIDLYEKTMAASGNDASVLKRLTETVIKQKRQTEYEVAQRVMSLILSRGWFTDKDGFDDTSVTIATDFGDVQGTLSFTDEEVKI